MGFALLQETYREWSSNKAPRLAAALSYYTLFALAPLLVICVQIGAFVVGMGQSNGHHHQILDVIMRQLRAAVGPAAAATVQEIVQGTVSHQGTGFFAGAVGWMTLLLAAGGLFGSLRDALNTIWEVPEGENRGFLRELRDRFASFAMVGGVAFLFLVSFLANALAQGFSAWLFPEQEALVQAANAAVTFALAVLLFAAIFKYLPDESVAWRDVWVGAFLTAVLFGVGQVLLGLYLTHVGATSTYGAAGSTVVLLIWVYYSSQILLFGAEFTRVYALRLGSRAPIAPVLRPALSP